MKETVTLVKPVSLVAFTTLVAQTRVSPPPKS